MADLLEMEETAEMLEMEDLAETVEVEVMAEMEEMPETEEMVEIAEMEDLAETEETVEMPETEEMVEMEDLVETEEMVEIEELVETAEMEDLAEIEEMVEMEDLMETMATVLLQQMATDTDLARNSLSSDPTPSKLPSSASSPATRRSTTGTSGSGRSLAPAVSGSSTRLSGPRCVRDRDSSGILQTVPSSTSATGTSGSRPSRSTSSPARWQWPLGNTTSPSQLVTGPSSAQSVKLRLNIRSFYIVDR